MPHPAGRQATGRFGVERRPWFAGVPESRSIRDSESEMPPEVSAPELAGPRLIRDSALASSGSTRIEHTELILKELAPDAIGFKAGP
jgi:hypothetical protein